MDKELTKIEFGDFPIFYKKSPFWETELFGLSLKKIAITGIFLHILKKLE